MISRKLYTYVYISYETKKTFTGPNNFDINLLKKKKRLWNYYYIIYNQYFILIIIFQFFF